MKNNEKLFKVTSIIAKIAEKMLWICALVSLGMFLFAIFGKNISDILTADFAESTDALKCMGFEMSVTDGVGNIIPSAVVLFLVAMVFLFSLSAMIFRNIHLILKKAKEDTPFCEDVVRMVREIGIFLIAIPVVGVIFSVVARPVVGVEVVETSVSFEKALIGLMMICLSGFFAYGKELEEDVDGLL